MASPLPPTSSASSFPILLHGREHLLAASCLGEQTGGGLCLHDGESCQVIDRLSSTGLHVNGNSLCRVLWTPSDMAEMTEVLVYDPNGVQRYLRLDGASDVHDILGDDGGGLVLVSTGTNEVLWYSEGGRLVRRWRAPGEGDSWHLNNLFQSDEGLCVSAFGQFQKHREWTGSKLSGSGCVIKLPSEEVALSGLMCPHNPRQMGGRWVVCNSSHGELVEIDPRTRSVVRRVELGRWTRGLAFTDELVFVGTSASRQSHAAGGMASIAVLDRGSWSLLCRIPLPFQEIYDLVLVPPPLAEGLRRGFFTNPLRTSEQEQHALFRQAGVEPLRLWATGDPLPQESCRIHLQAELPAALAAGATVTCECTVRNEGNAIYTTAPPCPVRFSYQWLDPATGQRLPDTEGIRTRLPRSLAPGTSATCEVAVQAPVQPGEWELVLTLVQEDVAWFSDLHEGNACRGRVQVGKR